MSKKNKFTGLEMILSPKQQLIADIEADPEKMRDVLRSMTSFDIFNLFDEDGSGLISFEEFRRMLPYLEIRITDAKAFRYFRMCDSDGTGEIDYDEFKVALFICDPTSGNPVGFVPGKMLTPLDAFEIFDENATGFIDEDEFFYALEFMKLNPTDHKHDKLFRKFDYNETGSIDLEEFREVFLIMCDVKKELAERGIDVPTFSRRVTLMDQLRGLLIDDEEKEKRAVAEAKRYKKWIMSVREKSKALKQAAFRAYQELRNALDAGGHVYIFGGGTHKQFDMPEIKKLKTDKFDFQFFERITELWKDRVKPQQMIDRLKLSRRTDEEDAKRDMDRNTSMGALGAVAANRKVIIDPYQEALQSEFKGLNVAMNTAALWGKRIHHVALTESVLFALADTGEVYTLGGNSFWWHEIQPDSIFQTKWRGDTTHRSKMLLGTMDKQLPPDESIDNVKAGADMSPEEKLAEVIKVTAKYYNVWEPPPNPAMRMIYLTKELLPKMQYDAVKFSLKVRGKDMGEKTKLELCEELYEDILIEKKLLGEKAHKAIRELESQIADLLKRRKFSLAEKFLKKIDEMWLPLREVQAEQRAASVAKELANKHASDMKIETDYLDMRSRLLDKRENLHPEVTPRGNSLRIDLSGVTPRGPYLSTPRGFQAAVQISAGTAHACLVHKSGQLYAWGMGASGRLGLDLTEDGDPQKDVVQPRLVQALYGRPVLRVSCGYSHTGAIAAGGDLYMWGSAANGKCGLGPLVKKEECFCSIPTKVMVGPSDRKIRKLSCGSAHTGVITEQGQLYIFGCGDGGRLGLGLGKYETMYDPVLVEGLLHEFLASVSCGNSTTLVCTEIKHEWVGEGGARFRVLQGGRVYAAGSQNVLGFQADNFLLVKDIEGTAIRAVSAGFQHTVLVSAEGELYCWGFNRKICCGVAPQAHFIEHPTVVPCLFANPINLALNKRAYQSSVFKKREAAFAINGDKDGNGIKRCSCTQQDAQPWIEIDLGQMCIIDEIRVWNRTDMPSEKNQAKDLYTARLFPCWAMISREPLSTKEGKIGMNDSLRDSVAKMRFTENQRMSSWQLPKNSQGRYVRVQLELFETLSLAEIEVYGSYGISKGVGRVSFASAGRDVTVAVIRPSNDPRDIESAYKRAAYSDAGNADILRQLETFSLEYDKFGRGEVLFKDCAICHGSPKCESCLLFDTYADEIAKIPPGIGGRRRRLRSIDDFLININKPELEFSTFRKKVRPSKTEMRNRRWKDFFSKMGFAKAKKHLEINPETALLEEPAVMLERIQNEEEAKLRAEGKSNAALASLMRSGKSTKKADTKEGNDDEVLDKSLGTETMKKITLFDSQSKLLFTADVEAIRNPKKVRGSVPKSLAIPAQAFTESQRADEEQRREKAVADEKKRLRENAIKKTGGVS